MADKGWDGWADPEAGGAASPFSLKDTISEATRKRYVWNGTFGEKYITAEYKVIVPYCGCCGAEGSKAFERMGSSCHVCGTRCWMGPLAIIEETPGPIILSPATPSAVPNVPVVSAITSVTSATSDPITGSHPTPPCSSSTAVREEQATVAMGGMSLNPPVNVTKPIPKGRGRGRGHKSLSEDKPPCQWVGPVPSASCSSEGNTPESLHTPDSEPDWKEMDFGPLPPSSSPEVNFFSYDVTPPKSSSTTSVTASATAVDTSFWVSPGRADPQKLRTVSRIQRIINIKVFDKWGYYMPYAPEFIYDEMEKHLDEWIYGELLRKEEIGSGGLFQSDPAKRERDLNFLSNVVHEWWYGRTILKHYVKSCGKFQEEKHFALSERLSNGGRIDKPHPNYYLSYQNTKAKSSLGKLSTHPSSEEV